jgi:hypothetical protein
MSEGSTDDERRTSGSGYPQHPLWDTESDTPKYAPLCGDALKVSNLKEFADAMDELLTG